MSFLDKAKDFLDKHDEQVDKLLDKAGEQVDRRTGGKYSDQIDKAVDEAQRRTGAGDTQPGPPARVRDGRNLNGRVTGLLPGSVVKGALGKALHSTVKADRGAVRHGGLQPRRVGGCGGAGVSGCGGARSVGVAPCAPVGVAPRQWVSRRRVRARPRALRVGVAREWSPWQRCGRATDGPASAFRPRPANASGGGPGGAMTSA